MSPAGRCGAVSGSFACDREAGHSGSHRGYNDAIDEAMFWASRPIEHGAALMTELVEARATIRRLNRRAQLAEAAVAMRVEQFEQRSKTALRSYYFAMAKNASLTTLLAENERLRAELARLTPAPVVVE